MKSLILSYILVLTGSIISLEAQINVEYLEKKNDLPRLQLVAANINQYESEMRQRVQTMAVQKAWPVNNLIELTAQGDPIYVTPTNNDASTLTRTVLTRSLYPVDGTGFNIGMWEAFENGTAADPRTSHQDFQKNGTSRIILNDPGAQSLHATHVAGTLIGNPPSGVSEASRGMIPGANLLSYDVSNHISEMATAASQFMLVSNHSYGFVSGYELDRIVQTSPTGGIIHREWTWYGGTADFVANGVDPKFGNYNFGNSMKNLDNMLVNAPFYLPVFSAGNDHNDNPNITVLVSRNDLIRDGVNGSYVRIDPSIHPSGDGFQSTNISGFACATNVLTVGNMTKDLSIQQSSSRGAMNDGRIKPDLCGIGTSIYSASNAGDQSYETLTGTSMSSPNVAGSLLLLQELYEQQNGSSGYFMLASQLKGLAIHSAKDQGSIGPDYTYGWGLLDTEEAAEMIALDSWSRGFSAAYILEEVLGTNNLMDEFIVNSGNGLKVTLCYTDPVDMSSSDALQNDLDITVTRLSNNQIFYPYILDPANPSNAATTGDNDVDNVEKIDLTPAEAPGGLYKVTVKLDGNSLYNNENQFYALIISGLNAECHYDINHRIGLQPPSATYRAKNQIESRGIINSNKNVTYQSGNRTILRRGFHAKAGSSFKVVIQNCPF